MNFRRNFYTIALASAVAFGGIGWFTENNSVSSAETNLTTEFQQKDVPANASGTYKFDPAHSNIGFRIKHLGLAEVAGRFGEFDGTVNYDAADVKKSSVNFTAKMSSVDTGVAGRDKHLRTADFFEVEKYPEMTFKSTKVEKKGKNIMVYGDFTMKGVTKQIVLPIQINGFLPKDPQGKSRMGFAVQTVINRQDYGITYGKTLDNGVLSIGNDVSINLQVEAVKQ